MAAFAVYARFEINNSPVSVEQVASLCKKRLSQHYSEDQIQLTADGFIVKGNLKSTWERAVTRAIGQIQIEGKVLSYRVEGTTSLGKWPWICFFIGFFTYGVFLSLWFIYLIEYLICRDRPKRYFEEAFQAVVFGLGGFPEASLDNVHQRTSLPKQVELRGSQGNAGIGQVYILREAQQLGPYSFDQIREYLASGNLQPNELAWYQGAPTWVPLSQVPGFIVPPPRAV